MSRYLVKSTLGDRTFAKEDDAVDYQIKILSQVGIKSERIDTADTCGNCGTKCGAIEPYGMDCTNHDQE